MCVGGNGIDGGGAARDSDDGGDGAECSAMAGEREEAEAGVEGANPSSISRLVRSVQCCRNKRKRIPPPEGGEAPPPSYQPSLQMD